MIKEKAEGQTIGLFLFFLSILCFGEETGQYYSAFNRVCGGLFLLFYLIHSEILWNISKKEKGFWFKYGVTLLLTLISFGSPVAVISVGLVLIISGLWRKRVEFSVGLIFFLYLLFKSYVPLFYYLEQGISAGLNYLLRIITSWGIDYSASAYGLGWMTIIIGFELLFLSKAMINLGQKIVQIFLIFFSILALQGLYFWLATKFITIIPPQEYNLNYYLYYLCKHFIPMNGQALLFTIAYFLTALLNKRLSGKDRNPVFSGELGKLKEKTLDGCLLLLFFCVLLMLYDSVNITDHTTGTEARIFVYDTGMDFQTIPSEEIYGISNGIFGMLFHYLEDLGYQVQLGVDWMEVKPERADLVIMLNPHGKMESGEREKILSFISKGGRLFLLGDHTHMFGLENDYFDLTRELGISFNFDTAIYFKDLWKGCLRSPNLTLDMMLKDQRYLTNIVQGASLSVTYPATPLIIGEYGWSDPGDLENESGYLGDRKYATKERTGDLVLAAKRDYGKGRILVFGDTSFLQNSPFSTSYPFIQLYLSILLNEEKTFWRILFPLLFLLLTLFYCIEGKDLKKFMGIPARLFSLIMMLAFLALAVSLSKKDPYFNLPARGERLRAGIDSNFYPTYYRNDWDSSNRGLGGLKNTLIREGFLPYVTFDLKVLKDNRLDLYLLLGPNKKILPEEADYLIRFVERGGTLIIAAGYEHHEQMTQLLEKISLKIMNTPYSLLEGEDTNLKLRFVSAWPLATDQGGRWSVLCQTWDEKPLIAEKPISRGRVIFVGDSYFFENRNLEMSNIYYKNNMEFFRNLLLRIKEQRVSR